MLGTRHAIVKRARSCHSKAAWQRFFAEPKVKKQLSSDSHVRSTVFSILKKDPLSPNYDPEMWTYLIRSCQKAWDQPLAETICRHIDGSQDPSLNLAMAETLLEGGHPRDVRRIASRCLRQPDLDDFHRVNFEMILSSGYLVEGKPMRAEAVLSPIDLRSAIDQDTPQKAALTCRNIARMYFTKGIYPSAGMLFARAAKFFKQDKSYNEAALSYYNAAAAYDNAGYGYHQYADKNLSDANSLARCYEIKVVSSYCYCFSGIVYYQKGDHKLSIANLELAMESLPDDEQGLRRVHILSFLCLGQIKMGRYEEALKLYEQRERLCRQDSDVARAAECPLLEAEILWLKGDWEAALVVLEKAIGPFKDRQVATIDELAVVGKYLTMNAKVGIKVPRRKFKIHADLENHRHSWLGYRLAITEQLSLSDDAKEHYAAAKDLLEQAKEWEAIFAAQGAHANILKHFVKTDEFGADFDHHRTSLEKSLESYPNSAQELSLLDIASTYRCGQFKEAAELVVRHYEADDQHNPYQHMVLEALYSVAKGKTGRIASPLGQKAVDTYTKNYLRPTISLDLPRSAWLGGTQEINLNCQGTVARFLACLADSPTGPVATSRLQQVVWNQSLNQKNWKQKIRNTVSRIRMLFKLALVPVVLQDSNEVTLNHDNIAFTRHGTEDDTDATLIELLRNRELSSTELAKLLDLSRSTTKRKLKKALDMRQIQSNKKGRNIYYSASDEA